MRQNKSEDLENTDTINKNKNIAPGENSFELVRKISYYNLEDNQIKIESDKIIRKRKKNQYLSILMLVIIYLIPYRRRPQEKISNDHRKSSFGLVP